MSLYNEVQQFVFHPNHPDHLVRLKLRSNGLERYRPEVLDVRVARGRTSGKELREEVVALRRRNRKLRAVLGILVAVLRTSSFWGSGFF